MKKSKLAVTAMLALLCLSVAGCFFSLVTGQLRERAQQQRLETFRTFELREKAAQAQENEFRAWQELPGVLKKFRREQFLSLDEFAAFRRDLDASLAANGLQPPRIDFAFGGSQGDIRKITAQFSLTGSYRSLKRFIFDMEAKKKMIFFPSLHLSAAGDAVKGAFTLEVYLGE